MARAFRNLERLKARLAAIPDAVKPPLLQALVRNADDLVALQQRLVPKGKTRDLEGSIRKEPGETDLSVLVKAGGPATTKEVRAGTGEPYDYALAIEYGTEHARAHPFFYPAYRSLRRRMKTRMAAAARDGIKAAVGSGVAGSGPAEGDTAEGGT